MGKRCATSDPLKTLIMPNILTLTEGPSTAKIHLDRGFNCFSFVLTQHDTAIEAFWSDPQFETGEEGGVFSGVPLLFPFPGRMRSTEMTWLGRAYTLPTTGDQPPIHGFVYDRPWRLVELTASEATAEFLLSREAPDRADCWPSDFLVTATYRLQSPTLTLQLSAENVGEVVMPWGWGAHPYFNIPRPDESCIQIPVGATWEMQGPYATGQVTPLEDPQSLQQGTPFVDMYYDQGFTKLQFRQGTAACRVLNSAGEGELQMSFGEMFPHLVVYTPPHRQAICMEPWTCMPDSVRLEAESFDSGLRRLAPGESFTADIRFQIG